MNRDRGPLVKQVCQAGCIGCGICAKQCESGAITVESNVAHVNYANCTQCGKCVAKCPVKVITPPLPDVSAVKAKTDNLPSSPAATSDIPTAATISGAVWSATTRTITGIPSTVADLLNQIHALLGDWTMGTTTLVTPEGNYTLTRDEDGNITKITLASTQGGT